MTFAIKLGTILSQLANVVLFGGHPDETLSARSYYERHDSKIWLLVHNAADFIFGDGHCKDAAESDRIFAEYVMTRVKQDRARGDK